MGFLPMKVVYTNSESTEDSVPQGPLDNMMLALSQVIVGVTLWRYQMGAFPALLSLCGESNGHRWILLTKGQ